MTPGSVPALFNRQLLHQRLMRAAAIRNFDNFLMRRITEDIASRVSLVKRDFDVSALFGDHSGIMAATLETLPNLNRLILCHSIDRGLPASASAHLVCCDEYLPFANECLNLAVLPLTLQFVNDLPGTLIQLKRSLKPDGLLIAAFLGGDSLIELRDALLSAEIDVKGGAAARIHPRADIRDLGTLLQRAGFALPVVDSDRITVTYGSVLALMHDLRALGLTSILTQSAGAGAGLNRSILARLEEIYKERYGAPGNRIRATFEIIYLTGWSPHDSQQKPLKPGSAQMRLADILKTEEISISDPSDT